MKLFLTFTLSILAFAVCSQDSISRNSRSFRIYSGAPFQAVGSTGDWYTPDFEIGFDVSHSVRIKNRFYVSLGLGANYSQFRTDPFVRTWTTLSFSPLSGTTSNSYTDDYERQTRGSFVNVRIPLQLEYIPIGKWALYGRAGFLFDIEVSYNSVDVFAHSNLAAPESYWYGSSDLYSHEFLLSGTASGGLKYRKENLELLFGLTSQIGFFDFNKNIRVDRIGIGAEFCIRKTIPNTEFPHRERDQSGSVKKPRSEYLFVEFGGSGYLGSLNYERTLIKNGEYRLNAKAGIGAFLAGNAQLSLPIGLNWISGEKRGFEIGVDVVPVIGSFSNSYLAPHAGYRAELGRKFLLRITAVGWWSIDGDVRVVPGVSLGARL